MIWISDFLAWLQRVLGLTPSIDTSIGPVANLILAHNKGTLFAPEPIQ